MVVDNLGQFPPPWLLFLFDVETVDRSYPARQCDTNEDARDREQRMDSDDPPRSPSAEVASSLSRLCQVIGFYV